MAPIDLPENIENFGRVVRRNLDVIRRDYGDGGPASLLLYHNELHTKNVMSNLSRLIAVWNAELPEQKISDREAELLQIAASGHDRVQNAAKRLGKAAPGDNERLSADDVAKEMQEAGGYTFEEIRFVRACILGTIPGFAPGKLTQPMVETVRMRDRGEISERQFELAKLLADADLGSFGQGFQTMYKWSMRFFRELQKDPEELVAYMQNQLSFVENHQWVSKVGEHAFPDKQEILDKLRELIVKMVD